MKPDQPRWTERNQTLLAGVIMACVGAFKLDSALFMAGGFIAAMCHAINQLRRFREEDAAEDAADEQNP
jgi:hypothetical protein